MPKKCFDLFFKSGEVCEIRVLGVHGKNPAWRGYCTGNPGVVAGYFDNAADFAKAAVAVEKANPAGIFFTVNPVVPAFLARSVNCLTANLKATTTDEAIDCIRWFLIDLDPKIKTGDGRYIKRPEISSTDDELAEAKEAAKTVAEWLEKECGFAAGIRACSGNGYHINYRLPDLPNTEETRGLIRQALSAVIAKHGGKKVDVDSTVFNQARIWKLYGTTGRKGQSTNTRPHRRSYILHGQSLNTIDDVPVTSAEALRKLAALAPSSSPTSPSYPPHTPKKSTTKSMRSNLGTLDMEAYLTHYGRSYKVKQSGSIILYCLAVCLFDENHKKYEAAICKSPNPPFLTYQCFHDSCKGRTWKEARAIISGTDNLAPYCDGYDPNWKPDNDPGTGLLKKIEIKADAQSKKTMAVTASNPLVPPPFDIDPMEFFERRNKRPVFVPLLMAKYIMAYLKHLVHTNGVFWTYEGGLWKTLSREALVRICVHALKEYVKGPDIDNSIKVCRGLVQKMEDEWEQHPELINCLSGMVNIEKQGEVLPHDPEYYSRIQIPCEYGLKYYSKIKRWWPFLDQIFPGEYGPEKIDILQQFFGYCFLPNCRYQKALFLYGAGANGKSKVLTALESVVGRENTSTLSMNDLSQRFKAHFLQEKLINIATETNTRDPISTEIFKAVVTGDPITAEHKYGDQYQFRPYAKFLVAMNETPVIPDKSHGFGRRIIVLNFTRIFKNHEQDPDLSDKLLIDKNGIFMWSLLGLEKLLKNNGFILPGRVKKDTKERLGNMNPVVGYIGEHLEVGDDFWEFSSVLYKDYRDWCAESGHRFMSKSNFRDQIISQCPGVEVKLFTEERRVCYVGVGLKKVQ